MTKLIFIFLSLLLTSCFDNIKETIKNNNKPDILYYSNKTVNSLEVPPDLTKPTQNNALILNKLVDTDKNLITFGEKKNKPIGKINTKNIIDIEVKKFGTQRWLVIKKDFNYLWINSQKFLRDNGFKIIKSNKKIGILETDYLENIANIPKRNLGIVRSLFKKTLKSSYSLPTVDKYRMRLEVLDKNTTEVYLSLNSMKEVVSNKGLDDENTVWQEKISDKLIEVEMLYRFMLYLGNDSNVAQERLQKAVIDSQIVVVVKKDLNGYAKLQFELDKNKTWDAMSWAFDKLNIDIKDKDKLDFSFYISGVNNNKQNVFANIFGSKSDDKNFRIKIKSLNEKVTEVYFTDISHENNKSIKDFSKTLFNNIVDKIYNRVNP